MTEHGVHDVRVALLARAGMARDQLHRALSEAGAQIVAEGDPAELDPKEVAECMPTVFLVSLEPSIEKALDRFDSLLAAPGVEVMFDDAEVTGKLDGWDLNRWARHMASKLLGSESLPPAPEGSMFADQEHQQIRPGAPPTPAELMDHAKLEDYTADTSELADWVPTSPSLTTASADHGTDGAASEEPSFSWDGSDAPGGTESDTEFKLDTDLGIDLDLSELESFSPTLDAELPSESTKESSGSTIADLLDQDLESAEPVRFSSFGEDAVESSLGDLDADVAQLAAQLEAFEKTDHRVAPTEPDFAKADNAQKGGREKPVPAAAENRYADARLASSSSARVSVNFDDLALAPADGSVAGGPSAAPIIPKFVEAADKLELKLTAIDGHEGLGAVLVLAGLGGPDAVRQLLSSLPESLRVPVLLYQHLEVGKHERLVEQLAKISKLPVVLATDGTVPASGKVTLLPAGMTAVAKGESLTFTPGALTQLIAALPARESMIIVLSGAEPQLVPMILSVKDAGGLVLAQDPEVCFDAAAAESMRREGAAVYPALGLARQIAARWPV